VTEQYLKPRPKPSDDDRPVLVLGPNPTPNGGMHLGHIAGPYLAGDVYARYQRARGRDVVFTTGTDDWQTFVVTSAQRKNTTPEELCRVSTIQIRDALTAIGISFDGFGPFDENYERTVLDYFSTLHAAGKFRPRTVKLPYLVSTGEFLVEGFIEGECPNCLSSSRGGLCETCNHPNNFDDLIDRHRTVAPEDEIGLKEATILVFPMEEYRERLRAFHEAMAPNWRPHLNQMLREVLAKPLPDLPITYPIAWGMKVPFPEVPGQVLNSWLELIPAGMWTSTYAAAQLGRKSRPGDLWRVEEDRRLVHFLGFDNAYYFNMTHMALLMAHGGPFIRPEWVLTNEFYEFENEKFSTSKQHVVTVEEILGEYPRDLVRLYLALTSPEYQRTSFSRVGLRKVVEGRLVGPWNELAATLADVLSGVGDGASLPVSDAGRGRAAALLARFDTTFEMPGYSLNRSADAILVQIGRLNRIAARLRDRGAQHGSEEWGDLFLEVRALLALASPILIDLGEAARQAGGFDGVLRPGAFDVAEVKPFAPPLLPGGSAETGDR
jgi:methionyl-tRNA synthetase